MKKTFKALKFPTVFLLFLASFIACDKDFSVIESEVLGKENANFFTNSLVLPISAYNKKLEAVQINNLPSNLLGFFDDPDYGKTTASIVTQLTPTTFPSASSTTDFFGTTPVIDSVVLSIPYYSTAISVDDDGNTEYTLDSIYGNSAAEIKLSIYQNNYFLRDFDPNTTSNSAQNYYSNPDSNVNSMLNGSSTINFEDHIGALILEHEFKPSANATVTKVGTGDDEVTTISAPALRVVLENNNFWKTTIIDKQDDPVLSDSNYFQDYFRGLYLKAEAIDDDGSMILVNLASTDANITIHYTEGETDSRTQSSYVLNFTGNRVNTFINDFSIPFGDIDKDNGDETLYLKGLEGSMAVVNLFPTDEALDDFKDMFRDSDGNQTKLINEAHLVIYEDDVVTNTEDDNGDEYHKYDRIYAYDINNNTPLIDYIDALDPTVNTITPVFSKIISLGLREESIGKYKIRLTEHLNNIIQNDSTNYLIGLVLSNNVNVTSTSEILNSTDDVTAVPTASIISPRGTILYGSNDAITAIDDTNGENKKLKLKVFFTEPK